MNWMTKDNIAIWLAITVTLGFIFLVAMLSFHDAPTNSHDIVMAMTGVLATAFGGIVNYYFGSSSGSAKKTEILANGKKPTE